jgi:hypothetical protein
MYIGSGGNVGGFEPFNLLIIKTLTDIEFS